MITAWIERLDFVPGSRGVGPLGGCPSFGAEIMSVTLSKGASESSRLCRRTHCGYKYECCLGEQQAMFRQSGVRRGYFSSLQETTKLLRSFDVPVTEPHYPFVDRTGHFC